MSVQRSLQTTFKEAMDRRLLDIDAAYRAMYACHADPEHLNDQSKEYMTVHQKFHEACQAMWRLKAAWGDVQR